MSRGVAWSQAGWEGSPTLCYHQVRVKARFNWRVLCISTGSPPAPRQAVALRSRVVGGFGEAAASLALPCQQRRDQDDLRRRRRLGQAGQEASHGGCGRLLAERVAGGGGGACSSARQGLSRSPALNKKPSSRLVRANSSLQRGELELDESMCWPATERFCVQSIELGDQSVVIRAPASITCCAARSGAS